MGLFHGLFFLPVILSWVGPPAYQSAQASFEKGGSPRVESKDSAHAYKAAEQNGGNVNKGTTNENALDNPAFKNGGVNNEVIDCLLTSI